MNDWLGDQVPALLTQHRGDWVVAWDRNIQAIVPTLDEAVALADRKGPVTGVMIRQVTDEPIRVPALALIPSSACSAIVSVSWTSHGWTCVSDAMMNHAVSSLCAA